MKSTALNKMGYTGIVTLSQYTNGKQFIIATAHNSGANPLFNFLSDCLLGDFDVAKYSLPSKVMLINKQKDGEVIPVSGFLYLYTKPEKVATAETEGRVRYRFMVPKTLLEDASFSHIRLFPSYAQTVDDYAAEVEAAITKNDLSSASVLVVDWELVVYNTADTEEN